MQRLKIKLFDRFDRDKLHGGTQHSLGNRFGVAEVVLLSPRIGTDIAGRHQPRIVAKRLELPTQVMRPDARLHADETEWHVGEPIIDLTARQLQGWWSCVAWDAPGAGSPIPTLRLGGAGARRVHPISGPALTSNAGYRG